MCTDPGSFLIRRIPVINRTAQVGQLEFVQCPQLVVGKGLGGGEIEDSRTTTVRCCGTVECTGERGHQECQGFTGRCASGDHDIASAVRQLRRIRLVCPGVGDSTSPDGIANLWMQPIWPADGCACPGWQVLDMH